MHEVNVQNRIIVFTPGHVDDWRQVSPEAVLVKKPALGGTPVKPNKNLKVLLAHSDTQVSGAIGSKENSVNDKTYSVTQSSALLVAQPPVKTAAQCDNSVDALKELSEAIQKWPWSEAYASLDLVPTKDSAKVNIIYLQRY